MVKKHVAHANSVTICKEDMMAFQIISEKLEEESVP